MPESFAYLDHPTVLAIAHRGGTSEAPENTLAAFQAAVDLGYRHVETDVHASADGVLYAFHDPDLGRVTGLAGRIAELTSRELDRLRFDGHRVPRFQELLASWPSLNVNVDPKADASVEPLVADIHRYGVLDRVCVGSFSDRRIAWCRRELGPGLCTSMGPFELVRLMVRSRGLPTGGFDAACVQIPPAQRLRFPGFGSTEVPVLTSRLLETARELGLKVHVWTIDDEAQMHDLLDLGVDGIMTDELRVLRSVFDRRRLWERDHD